MDRLATAQRRYDNQDGVTENTPNRDTYFADTVALLETVALAKQHDTWIREQTPVWQEMADSGLYGDGAAAYIGYFWQRACCAKAPADGIFTFRPTWDEKRNFPALHVVYSVSVWRDANQHIQFREISEAEAIESLYL